GTEDRTEGGGSDTPLLCKNRSNEADRLGVKSIDQGYDSADQDSRRLKRCPSSLVDRRIDLNYRRVLGHVSRLLIHLLSRGDHALGATCPETRVRLIRGSTTTSTRRSSDRLSPICQCRRVEPGNFLVVLGDRVDFGLRNQRGDIVFGTSAALAWGVRPGFPAPCAP